MGPPPLTYGFYEKTGKCTHLCCCENWSFVCCVGYLLVIVFQTSSLSVPLCACFETLSMLCVIWLGSMGDTEDREYNEGLNKVQQGFMQNPTWPINQGQRQIM